MIYLDNAATTPVHDSVLEAMMPYLKADFGNAGSVHTLGRSASKAIENARAQVANFLGAKPEQIVFTSGGSEGNNMVFSKSMKEYLISKGKFAVAVSAVEHDSVYVPAFKLSEENECIKSRFYTYEIPVNKDGSVLIDDLSRLLEENNDIGLVSVMCMNNETGSLNPIEDICKVCHDHDVLFHTDCVQAAGCYPINVNKIGCDFATISGHKLYAPKGVGAIYIKDMSVISPIITGSSTQEYGLRGGTENVPGIVGLGEACKIVTSVLSVSDSIYPLLKSMFYDKLIKELKNCNIDSIVHMNGRSAGKSLNIRFDNIDSETLVLLMDSNGVCISSGSACHGHESVPSRVLLASGLTEKEARESVRVSFSLYNTIEEVTIAAKIMAKCVCKLCKLNK